MNEIVRFLARMRWAKKGFSNTDKFEKRHLWHDELKIAQRDVEDSPAKYAKKYKKYVESKK